MLFTVTLDIHSHYRNIVLYDPYDLQGESCKIHNILQFACQYLPQALALRCYWELSQDKDHTGHGLFGTWHDIVTTDTTSQIPFSLEIRVQMDSYI